MTLWRILSLWAPVGAFMGLLFLLSSRTDLGGIPGEWDKVAHTAAYTVLGLLALRACHGGIRAVALRPTLLALLLTSGYAALDEWHQGRVAGRHASVLDWVADVVGAIVAVTIFSLWAIWWLRTAGSRRSGDTNGT